ncbi:MAG: peptidoglycan DD-metalloendopeptidase family protein [Myxococcaceae bacterium]
MVLLLLTGCLTPHPGVPPGVSLEGEHREPELVSARHRVEAGQTLYGIARTYGLSPDDLALANGITDPRTLAVGQELLIPGVPAARPVPAADGGEPPPETARVTVRPASATARRPPGSPSGTLDWPLRGVLYGRFGKKGSEQHDGIDLAAPEGTPVKTAAPGKVLFAGEQKGYGLLAIIEHAGGLVTLYAHNHDLRVKNGQQVAAGQVVATVGESGRTSGPHLHFEVRRGGVPVDPLGELKPAP